jgi:heptosyltransferase III
MIHPMDPKKILIIRNGGLGDTILLWPALAAMRRRFPTAEINLMGNADRCRALVFPGGADHALHVEGSGLHLLYGLSPVLPPEVVRDFGSYDAIVAFAAPGDHAIAENLSACGATEVHAFLPFPSAGAPVHVAEHAKQSLLDVDLAASGKDPLLPASEAERTAGLKRLSASGLDKRPLLLIAPGSGNRKKNWKPEGFAEMIRTMKDEGIDSALIQGPADEEAVTKVLGCIRGPLPHVFTNDSPSTLKGLLRHAVLFVGNDSGPSHLAAMLGVPTVALFGPSDPKRWSPRGPAVEVVRSHSGCAPCPEEMMQDCKDPSCMEHVDFADVMQSCRRLLERVPTASEP